MTLSNSSGARWPMQDKLGTMVDVLRQRVEDSPERQWLEIEGGESMTYAEVWELALRQAAGLEALGVERGATVATLMGKRLEGVSLWFACGAIGAVVVPINEALHGALLSHQ